MKLYYTGAKTYLGVQLDPGLSLGGLISSSEIPNGLLSNLFGSLSRYTVQNNKPELRIIVIKNDSGSTLTGLKAFFTYPVNDDSPPTDINDCEFLIGYGTVTADGCGDLSVEKLSSIYSSPYTVTLQADAIDYASGLVIPDLAAGTYVGIFIKRVLKSSTQQAMSDDDLESILDGDLVLDIQEDIGLTFQWN